MKNYIVKVNGIEHTMQLDAEDAKRLKATEIKVEAPADTKEAETKSEAPADTKEAETKSEAPADTKEAAPAENKSVRAANK